MTLLPEDDRYRINVFDWRAAFPQVFGEDGPALRSSAAGSGRSEGGFDAIVGNPPYIRIQTMKEWAPVEVDLYKTLFRTAASGNYDLYVVFVEQALRLLSRKGRLGFILPHKFMNAEYGRALRGLIAEARCLEGLVHFGDHQVFPGATTYTCLLFLDKAGADVCRFAKVLDLDEWRARARLPDGDSTAPWGQSSCGAPLRPLEIGRSLLAAGPSKRGA